MNDQPPFLKNKSEIPYKMQLFVQNSCIFKLKLQIMQLIRYLVLSFLILVSGLIYAQETEQKTTTQKKEQVPVSTDQKKTNNNNNIKTVPQAKLKQSQLKKINQTKAKLQAQKLKKAIRRSKIKRKPFRK